MEIIESDIWQYLVETRGGDVMTRYEEETRMMLKTILDKVSIDLHAAISCAQGMSDRLTDKAHDTLELLAVVPSPNSMQVHHVRTRSIIDRDCSTIALEIGRYLLKQMECDA